MDVIDDPPHHLTTAFAEPKAPDLISFLSRIISLSCSDDAADDEEAEFMMYQFKIAPCRRARSHDWTACPYAHPGEKARRRDPRRGEGYAGERCPDFARRGSCPRGLSCRLAHGTFELWLHPGRFRTEPCRDGAACRRPVCFFAHSPRELRSPPSPTSVLASLFDSPPVSPVAAARRAEEEDDLVRAMQELLVGKKSWMATAKAMPAPALPAADNEPDFGWVSDLLM